MAQTNNDKTLQTYNGKIKEYIQGTTVEIPKKWLDNSLNGVAKNAQILEIGSGFGRDADYIESLGYRVQTSDAAIGFVNVLKE